MKNKILKTLAVVTASASFSTLAVAAEGVVNPDGYIGGCIFNFCFYIMW